MSLKAFFSPQRTYAVVGASSNPAKYGYKVLNWYHNHQLPVIPVNPTTKEILNIPTVSSIVEAITSLDQNYHGHDGLSISFITPPHVSLQVLESIEENGLKGVVKGVWFQPGAYDSAVIQKSQELGFNPLIENDECILVSGDDGYVKSHLKSSL